MSSLVSLLIVCSAPCFLSVIVYVYTDVNVLPSVPVSVTVHGFPVPSSPCLVCVRVRMCEQVSVGVCD